MRVRVRGLQWFKDNCDCKFDNYYLNDYTPYFADKMAVYCGKQIEVQEFDVNFHTGAIQYELVERAHLDEEFWTWEGWMFEPKSETVERILTKYNE